MVGYGSAAASEAGEATHPVFLGLLEGLSLQLDERLFVLFDGICQILALSLLVELLLPVCMVTARRKGIGRDWVLADKFQTYREGRFCRSPAAGVRLSEWPARV